MLPAVSVYFRLPRLAHHITAHEPFTLSGVKEMARDRHKPNVKRRPGETASSHSTGTAASMDFYFTHPFSVFNFNLDNPFNISITHEITILEQFFSVLHHSSYSGNKARIMNKARTAGLLWPWPVAQPKIEIQSPNYSYF